jgi:hypothetical protein
MFRRFRFRHVMRLYALALAIWCCAACVVITKAQDMLPVGQPGVQGGQPWEMGAVGYEPQFAPPALAQQTWIASPADQPQMLPPVTTYSDPGWGEQPVVLPSVMDAWHWQVLPDGLIYHSYWAGVHEPRLGIVMQKTTHSDSFFDGTLGGRVGLLRYGSSNAIFPQGWQLDAEAAALVRLTLDEVRDFETADYRVGVPLTYGIDNWQFKLAAYHLSSHLGDEFAIAHPGSLADRINYVRYEAVLGASYYPVPSMRLYAEAGWAFNTDGGAEPWEFQFGTEIAAPGPTGPRGTPFFAVNGHLRQELDFGGDVSTQAGWLWRGNSGQVFRVGLHYFNGKSSQYQTFTQFEEQIGLGLWYDF